MVTITLHNKSINNQTLTYLSSIETASIILKGGSSRVITNTGSTVNPELPDNVLNLPVDDEQVLISDFKYDKNYVSVQLTTN